MSQLLNIIKVSRMNAGRNTPKKPQSPQRNPKVQMRVFFVAWVLKFQSVISADLIPQSGVDKIRLAGLEKTCCVEVNSQEGKS